MIRYILQSRTERISETSYNDKMTRIQKNRLSNRLTKGTSEKNEHLVERIKMAMTSTLEWVFSFSLLSFLFDNTLQTSLGEETWTAVAREIGIYYQLKREHHTAC